MTVEQIKAEIESRVKEYNALERTPETEEVIYELWDLLNFIDGKF